MSDAQLTLHDTQQRVQWKLAADAVLLDGLNAPCATTFRTARLAADGMLMATALGTGDWDQSRRTAIAKNLLALLEG